MRCDVVRGDVVPGVSVRWEDGEVVPLRVGEVVRV